jgi:hypothetical protein
MRYSDAKKHPETKDTMHLLMICGGQLKHNKRYGNRRKVIFTSTEKIASWVSLLRNELISVRIKNKIKNQKRGYFKPLMKASFSRLKNETKVHATIIAERTNEPNGRQKQ